MENMDKCPQPRLRARELHGLIVENIYEFDQSVLIAFVDVKIFIYLNVVWRTRRNVFLGKFL